MGNYSLRIEMQKLRRTGVIGTFIFTGVAGAIYAIMNWYVRKDILLSADIDPMTTLLTQLYGVICLINIFAIVVSTSNIYHIEYQNNGLKKMKTLPIKASEIFISKLVILISTLLLSYMIEFVALAFLGKKYLPNSSFDFHTLVQFGFYIFLISLPCLTFMLVVSILSTNLWISIGVGVIGFFSGMSMIVTDNSINFVNPFSLILIPSVSLSAKVDIFIMLTSVFETIVLVAAGIMIANKRRYE